LRSAAAALVLLAATAGAAPPATPGAKKTGLESPFDVDAPTPHRISAVVDPAPARDILALVTGGPEAPATLRRLKEYPSIRLAIAKEGLSPDDYFGRLVAAVAGTPDPLVETFERGSQKYRVFLDELAAEGPGLLETGARRVASILPPSPAVTARLVLVPFFSTAGFSEVLAVPQGDTVYLFGDVPKLVGDISSTTTAREVVLSMMRSALAQAWLTLFEANVKKPPAWPDEDALDFDGLLARTVSEGPATLFLFPDEFTPIGALLEEPIARSFARWNRAVEVLTDPKKKEPEKRDALADSTRGDFWRRYGSIVGAAMTDSLIRRVGREAYLHALAEGPRAVALLYLAETKAGKLPAFGPAAKKALEHPAPTPSPKPTPGTSTAG
jgi:hypothetical protein